MVKQVMRVVLVLMVLVGVGEVGADEQKTLTDAKLQLQIPDGWTMTELLRDGAVTTYDLYWKTMDVHGALYVLSIEKIGSVQKARSMFIQMGQTEKQLDIDTMVRGTMQMQGCEGDRMDISEDDRYVRVELCIHPDKSVAYLWHVVVHPWQKAQQAVILKAFSSMVSQRAVLLDASGLPLGGGMDNTAMEALFTQGSGALNAACASERIQGAMTLELSISADGKLEGITPVSNPLGLKTSECVKGVMETWTFPSTPKGIQVVRKIELETPGAP